MKFTICHCVIIVLESIEWHWFVSGWQAVQPGAGGDQKRQSTPDWEREVSCHVSTGFSLNKKAKFSPAKALSNVFYLKFQTSVSIFISLSKVWSA